MFNLKSKIKKMKNQKYFIVYKNADNAVKTYEIGRPELTESFGNKNEERNNIGFKAFCLQETRFALLGMIVLFP